MKTFSNPCFDQPSPFPGCGIAFTLHFLQQHDAFPQLPPFIWIPGNFLVIWCPSHLSSSYKHYKPIHPLLCSFHRRYIKVNKPSWHLSWTSLSDVNHAWKERQNQQCCRREVTTLRCDHEQFLQLCLQPAFSVMTISIYLSALRICNLLFFSQKELNTVWMLSQYI